MAQFDLLIAFPLLWSLVLVLLFYYNMSLKILIPNFFGTKKFRGKKLDLVDSYKFFNENPKTKTRSSYTSFSD